jgi:FKBP-type peptidyl-prolyl cis-trans isomerase FklB
MGRRTPLILIGVCAAAAIVWAVRPSVSPLAPAVVAADENPPASPKADLKTDRQKGSYALGHKIAANIHRQLGDTTLDLDAFLLGMREALSGKGHSMNDAECEKAFNAFQSELSVRKISAAKSVAAKNKKEGEAFLAANKTKPGVATLPSGIQYLVLKEGTGKQPRATDEVKVHYHGTLIDGTVFDSSVNRGEPSTFRLDQVIPGWTESVQKMKEGSKWRIFIPSDLAYGPNGRPGIAPNTMLIFEIELLEVK